MTPYHLNQFVCMSRTSISRASSNINAQLKTSKWWNSNQTAKPTVTTKCQRCNLYHQIICLAAHWNSLEAITPPLQVKNWMEGEPNGLETEDLNRMGKVSSKNVPPEFPKVSMMHWTYPNLTSFPGVANNWASVYRASVVLKVKTVTKAKVKPKPNQLSKSYEKVAMINPSSTQSSLTVVRRMILCLDLQKNSVSINFLMKLKCTL